MPSSVDDYLREQYAGVLDGDQLDIHRENYVGTRMAHELLDLLRRRRPDATRVLDIGSGYGSFVLVARQAGLDAVGIELAPVEVDYARERLAAERPADDAESVYSLGDAASLEYGDGSFDAVTLWNVLEHIPRYERVLAQVARVLRPGGSVLILAPNYASFRYEAHYHVPWPPLLPKRLGIAYLERLGRNPRFFADSVYPCTKVGVVRRLRRQGFEVRETRAEKVRNPESISNPTARRAVLALNRARIAPVAAAAVRAASLNPLSRGIFIEAFKAPR